MRIQKLRLKQGWSQQQLAEASGLSARTIQRIEAGQTPSIETLKSLAAVFNVDFSSLQPENTMATTPLAANSPLDTSDERAERQEEEAFTYVRRLRRFYQHCLRYIVINLILLGINLTLAPHRLWALWVLGGWGLGLALHAFRIFGPAGWLDAAWEKQQVEKRLGRPL